MAPDQTIRVMKNKFYIHDGNGMEILNRLKISDEIPFSKDGNSQQLRIFPMRFSFPRTEIPDRIKIFQ